MASYSKLANLPDEDEPKKAKASKLATLSDEDIAQAEQAQIEPTEWQK